MNQAELDTLFRRGGEALGIELRDPEIARLSTYLALLVKWNARINLTATRDERELVVQHILDALAVVPHVPADATRAVDVGSGGGFPSAVIAIMRPGLAVTALEPVNKKHAFLATVRRELGLGNYHPFAVRMEAHMQDPAFRPYDVASSRATFALPAWLAHGASLVRPGGVVLGMEGAEQHPLPPGARRHPYTLLDMGARTEARTRAVIVYMPSPAAG